MVILNELLLNNTMYKFISNILSKQFVFLNGGRGEIRKKPIPLFMSLLQMTHFSI
jgi:hypothetical protein